MTVSHRRDAGFAIVLVLGAVAVLGMIVLSLQRESGHLITYATDLRRASEDDATMDCALAWLGSQMASPADGIPGLQTAVSVTLCGRRLDIRVEDEGGKVDLLQAPRNLRTAVLERSGAAPGDIMRLLALGDDWQQKPDVTIADDLRRAIKTAFPVGSTAGWFTLHGNASEVNLWTAPPQLLAALPYLTDIQRADIANRRQALPDNILARVVRLKVILLLRDRPQSQRRLVVILQRDADGFRAPQILSWGDEI